MYEILISWIIAAVVTIPIVIVHKCASKKARARATERARKSREREEDEMARQMAAYESEKEKGAKVLAILKSCYLDLKKQRAAAFQPWISALLDRAGEYYIEKDERGRVLVGRYAERIEPALALEAVRRTIRDLCNVPASYDKDGNEMPRRTPNLEALLRAESDLLGMGA